LALKHAARRVHYYKFEYTTKNEDPLKKNVKKVSEKL